MNRILRKILKGLGWTIVSIIALLLLVIILIQIPAVQNFARGKIVAFLEKKIGTNVEIGRLSIKFPKKVVLEDVFFEDQRHDTLLAGKRLAVDLAMFKLIKGEVMINDVELEGIRTHIYRTGSDTVFNYDYIVKAFVTEDTTKVEDTSSAPMKMSIDHVKLTNVSAAFRDDQTGADMSVFIGGFETNIDKFDLAANAYEVKDLKLDKTIARIYQHKPLLEPKPVAVVKAEAQEPMNISLKIGPVDLTTLDIDFANDVSAFRAKAAVGKLRIVPEKIDLQTLDISLKEFVLNNTRSEITLGNSPAAEIVEEQTEETVAAQAENPWKFTVDELRMENNNLKFDNNTQPRIAAGMDYGHMDIRGLALSADNLAITPTQYSGDVAQLAFREENADFNLKTLRADFLYNERGAKLDNLLLQTDNTELKEAIAVTWPSLETIATQSGEILLDINLPDSRVALKDVITFAPQMASMPPFKGNANAVLNLDARMRGYVKDLLIEKLAISGFRGTRANISGRIKGLPDPVKTYYDLNIAELRTTATDLGYFLPAGSLPPNIRIPETISVKGNFAGTASTFGTDLNIATSRGVATVKGTIRNMGAGYNLNVATRDLDLGYIMKQEATMGKFSAAASVTGSGFDPNTMVATIRGNVQSAQLQGYTYRNLVLNAKMNRGNIAATANMRDPNLAFDMDIAAAMKGDFPAVKGVINLDSVDLQALGLYKEPLRIHGDIVADFESTNPDNLLGTLNIADLFIATKDQRFAVDTIAIAATESAAGNRLELAAPSASVVMEGVYKLTEIAPALQQTINQYYKLPGYKPVAFAPQQWTLDAKITPGPLRDALAPQIKGTDTINASVAFNSAANDLSLIATAPLIILNNTNRIDSLNIRANTAQALDYAVSMQSANMGTMKLNHTALTGNVANNVLDANLEVHDAAGNERYGLGAQAAATVNDGVQVSLKEGLLLDYQNWAVGDGNYIKYDNTGIVVNNFSISNNGQSLSISSTSQSPESPIDVSFNNFSIETITRLAMQDTTLAGGIINGNAQVRDPMGNISFTSDINVTALSFMQDTIGDLALRVTPSTAEQLNTDVRLTGNGNDVNLGGTYYVPDQRLAMNLLINNLNLSSAKAFSGGQLDSAGGSLTGNIAIAGTVPAPSLNGELNFNDAFVKPTLLGERFTIRDNTIVVNNEGLHFNQFTLADSANNTAVIDGDLLTSDFKNYRFNLDVLADNFRAVNSTRAQTGQPFYGKLNLSTNLKVRGDMNTPDIDGRLRINDGTDFVAIMPTADPEVQSREGVVEFVDYSNPDTNMFAATGADTMNNTGLKGIDLTAVVETDSNAQFTLIIDERNGDAVRLRGTANLAAGMDRSGKVSLTGNYTMQEGSYVLTLNFLKRRFAVVPGSTIDWNGDPLTAQVNLTAEYIANTASLDLVEHQLTGRSQQEINRYKQKLPFSVHLKMKGELMKPQVSFDIILPERYAAQWKEVDQKLDQVRNDQSELNKQVFALLLLGRFVDENPLDNSAGGGNAAEAFVRQSASRILTDQLNRLAGNLIRGVDLTFGVNSGDDYSSGQLEQRTDVTVGLSKRLLNDRLRVNVGSAFEVEGPRTSNQQASNIGGDVSLDYQLSKDGRYQIRAYRRNEYDGLAEGQVVESGLTFLFTLDYDKFSEFFRKKNKEQDKKK